MSPHSEDAGKALRPIGEVLAGLIAAAALRSRRPLTTAPRLARLARELRGQSFRPVVVRDKKL
jgi:hypothetical protein